MLIGEDITIWLRPVVQCYFLSTAGKAVDNAVTALSMHPTVILQHKDRLFESVPTKRAALPEVGLEMYPRWFYVAIEIRRQHDVLKDVTQLMVDSWLSGMSVYVVPSEQQWVRLHRYA